MGGLTYGVGNVRALINIRRLWPPAPGDLERAFGVVLGLDVPWS